MSNYSSGYYSLVQFNPDRARSEGVNVGVLLFSPKVGVLDVKLASEPKRARRLFGKNSIPQRVFTDMKRSLEDRIDTERKYLRDKEDLVRFVQSRAHDFSFTIPKAYKFEESERALRKLFDEFVETQRAVRERTHVEKKLDKFFTPFVQSGEVVVNERYLIPGIGKKIEIPYSFQNGVLNLVKPQPIAKDIDQAIDRSMILAVEADRLQDKGANGAPCCVTIVAAPRANGIHDGTELDVFDTVYSKYGINFVRPSKLDQFMSDVKHRIETH